MRRTRLRWMYIPRTPKKREREHPMQVQNSEHFLRTAAAVATLTCVVAAVMALRKVQRRSRQSEQELTRKRGGQNVVIIGAGAGGCAAAALIANASPDVRVTVIEKDRQQVFQGHVPLAHVGHRSYDLGTTSGVDSLRSPVTWNVTRDANLVIAEVLRVDPEAKQVYVQSSPGILASAKPLSAEETRAAAPAHPLVRWWRGVPTTPATVSANEDGSLNLSDGTTVLSYDALIIAAGAQRTVGHLRHQLLPQQIDSYRIAVNPGTTRDSLATIFSGNVMYIKMPPASFVWQMEAARALMGKGRMSQGDGCMSLDMGVQMETAAASSSAMPSASATDSVPLGILTSSVDTPVLSTLWRAVRGFLVRKVNTSNALSADDAIEKASLPDEVALRLAAKAGKLTAPSSSSQPWPLFLLSQWCMHFSSRQHDSTFVSSTNTIWKYLWHYNKLSLCHLFAVTADVQPIGPAPQQVNEVIERFWRERQLGSRCSSDVEGNRFHALYHSYVTSIDCHTNAVTLYDYKNNAEVRVPFQLVVLDLPLRAPGFVRQSGLHRTRYVEECVLPSLAEGARTAAEGIEQVGSATAATAASAKALRKHPLLGKTKADLEAIFADEASFMDVDPTTLQHRRYSDVFALGDVAGLPCAKSYGAVFAQVPVVSHNVRQVLKAQQMQAPASSSSDADLTQCKTKAAATPAQADVPAQALPCANAHYTGYSSFHVIMTTWRSMWPEMRYPFDPHCKTEPLPPLTSNTAAPQKEETEMQKRVKWDVMSPLTYCDHHLWNNLAWRDLRGLMNGLYSQLALYELMYFFVFSRGQWHSPTWFSVPTFASEDGAPCVPSLLGFL